MVPTAMSGSLSDGGSTKLGVIPRGGGPAGILERSTPGATDDELIVKRKNGSVYAENNACKKGVQKKKWKVRKKRPVFDPKNASDLQHPPLDGQTRSIHMTKSFQLFGSRTLEPIKSSRV